MPRDPGDGVLADRGAVPIKTSISALECPAGLRGVKAKPFGWPAASLDTALGRLLLAAIENDAHDQSDQSPGTRPASFTAARRPTGHAHAFGLGLALPAG